MSDTPLTTDLQASHTPGPWSNERIWDTPESRIHARVEGVPMALAEVFTMRNAGEKEANARLIAAAPELLQSLKDLLERVELNGGIGVYQGGKPFVLADVRNAIAKAEGKL